jgi:DNA helicase-2/ATP-dependent DNA helicase PcrA
MFIKEGIPYKIIGGLKFYDRKETKDIIAYLRVIQNPSDNISLKRIINVPKRGIGNTTVETAEIIARNRGLSLFSVISASNEISELQRPSAKLQNFVALIMRFRALKETMNISELIEQILEQSGILKELQDENTVESEGRIENIKELISKAMEFEKQSEENGLDEFLHNVSLVSDIDNLEDNNNKVVLMTLHSAKGLEFPFVFMVGLEEGVFPGYRAMTDESEVEEERRLCYVGITRAREKLFMTNATCRTLFGNTAYNKVSRFLAEIPRNLIETNSQSKFSPKNAPLITKLSEQNAYVQAFTHSQKPLISEMNFIKGDTVVHKKFGLGIITLIEKENADYKLDINFKDTGMKRLMAAYANLTKVD